MIKLYLHIGTEKTGSSFIQSYLANNREMLSQHGIYFPTAGKREADMIAGRISPGNAGALNEFLDKKDWKGVQQWLQQKIQECQTHDCNQLLLSNEILIKTFSKKDRLSRFLKISKALKFENESFLLYIREPVSQALSLYKHRSKRGNMLPVDEWLENHYNLPQCLSDFYAIIKDLPIRLHQYPYKKDSDFLIDTCINKSLGLNETIQFEKKSVNPSLTLSELTLLSEIKKKDAYLARQFYNKMIDINISHKARDKDLDTQISYQISNYMSQFNDLWETVNKYMSLPAEKYQYNFNNLKSTENLTLNFSNTQVLALGQLISYAGSWRFLKYKSLQKIKTVLLQLTPQFVINLKNKSF